MYFTNLQIGINAETRYRATQYHITTPEITLHNEFTITQKLLFQQYY